MPRNSAPDPISHYLSEIQHNLSSGIAREQTHRPALKDLIESVDPSIDAFNDPKHIDVGAPDFTIRRKGHATDFPVGWIETKDIGDDLDKAEKSDQLKRYFGLHNVILTDYLEFRWYVDGRPRLTARIASGSPSTKRLRREPEGARKLLVLLHQFFAQSLATLYTPQDLAQRMAKLAHLIRDLLLRSLQTESASGRLHGQFEAFRETLIPDLKPEQFADMYAQTIAYGLFAARCQTLASARDFNRTAAAELIPRTNPFLRRLFREIAFELDPRVQPFVDDLVALLRHAEIAKIMEDFGKRTAREDPVVHFYEDFLQEYDPKVREMRGVYYTPEPVVSYIVRSVDYLLKTKFNKPLGLADKDVLILDPACGTGTFLYYVIRHIHDALLANGQRGQWNSYVSENLLKRVFGFELLMAPYAVAHLKLGLLLQELGYKFETDERLGIYLTNTLEEAIRRSEKIFADWISEEANAASEIKREKPIMVILGNPPYSGISANRGRWITQLIESYKAIEGRPLHERKHWLHDDYVKFIRFAQWRIEKTGHGILGFVTNHSYLDNPTFRGMRYSLRKTFEKIHILDLHGNSKKQLTAPDGTIDRNVFDIQQGVAISVLTKEERSPAPGSIGHADIWGSRQTKYETLLESDISTTSWEKIDPHPPHFLFVPRGDAFREEWDNAFSIPDILKKHGSGIASARDHFVIDADLKILQARIDELLHSATAEEIRSSFGLGDTRGWHLPEARKAIQADTERNTRFARILYRPFDSRWIFYATYLVDWPRQDVMSQFLSGENLGLICSRPQAPPSFSHVFCSRQIIDQSASSNKSRGGGNCYVFPLFLLPSLPEKAQKTILATRQANISDHFRNALTQKLGLDMHEDATRGQSETCNPFEVLAYIYAVLHSPAYRIRYASYLRVDFPHVPLTGDRKLFYALAQKGAELISLHLLESPKLNPFLTRYEQPGDHLVERISRVEPNPKAGFVSSRVYINRNQFFEGVPKEVWDFQIGGYQVCEKWLKDRKGRKLSSDDIDHYQKIVGAVSETIRIMREIDEIIPGWPLP